MVSRFLRMLTEKQEELSPEELKQGKALVEEKLKTLQTEKHLYMKLHQFDKWGELDVEEQMLNRLLAEYEVLIGDDS